MIYGGVDDNAIPQADVNVAGVARATTDAGMAQFVLEAGNHEVQVRLPAELSNLIAPANVSCAVTQGEFQIQWIRVRSAVTFRVQQMAAGAATEFAGVRLKLKDLAERDTVLRDELALATFEIPDAQPEQQRTCEVVSLKLDGADDIYEVEE